jgi:hypothetical protein
LKTVSVKITENEKESMIRITEEKIKDLKLYGSMEEFAHLANLLYVYQKLTGKNYEEVEHED